MSYDDALARALAYSDDVGLSDGTDRPAADAETALEECSAHLSIDTVTRRICHHGPACLLATKFRWVLVQ